MSNFSFAKIPQIYFGSGELKKLPGIIERIGTNVLIITGSNSFRQSSFYEELRLSLKEANITVFEVSVTGEPSPQFVDSVVESHRDKNISVVVGIGGGSAVDAGKAISAMLTQQGSVKQFLEGMETSTHNGEKIPYIAVPTSSGTGSEATKNAVLSEIGEKGFKKSLRHNNFVPDIAVLDPSLTLSCPPKVTATCGLDALTQLLEAYVSTQSSPMTDALCISGIEHFKEGFLSAFRNGSTDILAREHMSYASLMSGITLANAGLGVVHGFASPVGGYFDIPHGVVCGTLLAEATKVNIEAMLKNEEAYTVALDKYAKAGGLLSGKAYTSAVDGCNLLIEALNTLIEETDMPLLSKYGISEKDVDKLVAGTTNKNSPVKLDREDITSIIRARI